MTVRCNCLLGDWRKLCRTPFDAAMGWLPDAKKDSPRKPPDNRAGDDNHDENDSCRKSLRQTFANELRLFAAGCFGRVDRHAAQLFSQLRLQRIVVDSFESPRAED